MQVNNDKTMLALKEASTEVSSLVSSLVNEVEAIEKEYGSIVPQPETKDGYNFCKEVRKNVLPIKSAMETARKTLKAPVIEMGKLIDSSLNPLTDRLDAVYKPFEDAYREVDNRKKIAEEKRQVEIQAAFDKLNDSALEAIGQTSTVIEVIIEDIQDYSFDPEVFQERTDEAIRKQSELLGKLDQMLKGAIAQEETEAKLAKLAEMEEAQRIADEAKAKAEREAEIAAKAIEDYKLKAEADRIERDKQAALHAEQAKAAEAARAAQKVESITEAEALREMQSSYSESEGIYEQQVADSKRRIFAPTITKSDAVAVNDVERELTEIEQAYKDGFTDGLNFKGIRYDGVEDRATEVYSERRNAA